MSSTFARQPLLAVVAGVRSGAGVRRADPAAVGRAVRRAERTARRGKGDLRAAVPASRAGAGRRVFGCPSLWCAGSAPSRRSSDDGDAEGRERLAELLGQPDARVAGHKPWPRYEVDADAWTADRRRRLGEGGGDLLGLWARRTNVHLALRVAGEPRPCVVSVRTRTSDLPRRSAVSIRRRCGWSARCAISTASAPLGIPDRRPWLDHGAWGVRAPLGSRSPAARRDPAGYDFLPVNGAGAPPDPGRAGARRHHRSLATSASPPTARRWCGSRSGSATSHRGRRRARSTRHRFEPRARVVGAYLRRFHGGLQLRLRARRGRGARHRPAAARQILREHHGRAGAPRQPPRRHRRNLQRRGVCADPRALRHLPRARSARRPTAPSITG